MLAASKIQDIARTARMILGLEIEHPGVNISPGTAIMLAEAVAALVDEIGRLKSEHARFIRTSKWMTGRDAETPRDAFDLMANEIHRLRAPAGEPGSSWVAFADRWPSDDEAPCFVAFIDLDAAEAVICVDWYIGGTVAWRDEITNPNYDEPDDRGATHWMIIEQPPQMRRTPT